MKTTVVIGGGFGGLAAAARLRARGHRVTLLEAGAELGGRARAFSREGFHFDAGPTVITAPHLFDELFALFGKERRDYFDLVPVNPFYRVVFPDGRKFDYVGDDERLFSEIASFNASDVDGYRKLVEHSQRIFDVGYTELVDADFSRFGDMARIIPDLVRLRAYKSLYGLVSEYIEDEALRQVFTFQPLLIGGNPFRAPGIYLLIHWLERKWGVHFASGGTAAIVRGLARLLEEVGVDVRLDSPVARIEIDRGCACGVVLEDQTFIATDTVVSNADPATVYRTMVDHSVRRKHTDASLARKRYSMSLFVGYFGTDKTYPDLAHHSILLGPRYRELLTDIFDRKTLAPDFSLYLHAPTRTDPGLAPPGSESFYVLSPVPNQRSGIDWEREGPRYMERILDALDAHHLPGLRDHLVTKFHVDPRYFEDELRSYVGAAFGPEPTLRQSAYFRFHNASEDVRGLFFVGAGVHPGAGLPGVLSSAKVLDKVVPEPSNEGRFVSVAETMAVLPSERRRRETEHWQVLAFRARSFRWATAFLDRDQRRRVAGLYAFCRSMDDLADGDLGTPEARQDLEAIRHALGAEPEGECLWPERYLWFRELCLECQIDFRVVEELMTGMMSDLESVRLQSDRDLIRYCYRAAGTVGLMMCSVLGVHDWRAWRHAIDLGIAMQLTNIARDVREDAERSRVYLPAEQLRLYGVEAEALVLQEADPEAVSVVVADIIARAEDYYRSGDAGMRFLPPRARWAVLVASRLYRGIGRRLRHRYHGNALSGRVVVPWFVKALLVARSTASWLRLSLWPPSVGSGLSDEHLAGLPYVGLAPVEPRQGDSDRETAAEDGAPPEPNNVIPEPRQDRASL